MKKALLFITAFFLTITSFGQTDLTPTKNGGINQGQWDGDLFLSTYSCRNSTSWMRYGLSFFDLNMYNSENIQSISYKVFWSKVEHHDGSWVDYDLSDVNGLCTFELYVLDYDEETHDFETDDSNINWDYIVDGQAIAMTKVAELIDVPYSSLNSLLTFSSDDLTNTVKSYAGGTKKICFVLKTLTGNDTNPTKIRFYFNTVNDETDKPTLSLDLATDINDNVLESAVKIYPNPATSVINFTEEVVIANIYNVGGKLVKTTEPTERLNIEDLTYGLYMVEITAIDGTVTIQKLIVK